MEKHFFLLTFFGGDAHMIHTSDNWHTHVIHEIHEERNEILAIPHRKRNEKRVGDTCGT